MTETQKIQIGVGAVVFRGDTVLIIKRAKPPLAGQWSIPGGKLEFGEALEDGIHREVAEETGVTIRLLGLIGVYEALPAITDGAHLVMIDYAAQWVSGEPIAGDDAADALFTPIDDACSRIAWEVTCQAIRDARIQQQQKPGSAQG